MDATYTRANSRDAAGWAEWAAPTEGTSAESSPMGISACEPEVFARFPMDATYTRANSRDASFAR